MEITDVRVHPVDEDRLKAFVSVVFDRCFVVTDIKVIDGPAGLFVAMPSKRRKDGTFKDVAHPLNSETRRTLEERILAQYEHALGAGDGSAGSDRGTAEAAADEESQRGLGNEGERS